MFTYRYRELAVALEKKGEVRLALAKTLRVKSSISKSNVFRWTPDAKATCTGPIMSFST